jgi:hypothetical protein
MGKGRLCTARATTILFTLSSPVFEFLYNATFLPSLRRKQTNPQQLPSAPWHNGDIVYEYSTLPIWLVVDNPHCTSVSHVTLVFLPVCLPLGPGTSWDKIVVETSYNTLSHKGSAPRPSTAATAGRKTHQSSCTTCLIPRLYASHSSPRTSCPPPPWCGCL